MQYGGAIYAGFSSVTVERSWFEGNTAIRSVSAPMPLLPSHGWLRICSVQQNGRSSGMVALAHLRATWSSKRISLPVCANRCHTYQMDIIMTVM